MSRLCTLMEVSDPLLPLALSDWTDDSAGSTLAQPAFK